MMDHLCRLLDLSGANLKQKIWLNKDDFEIYANHSEVIIIDGFRVIKSIMYGYEFFVYCIDDVKDILSTRLKNETIDEKIETCTAHCKDFGDQCCQEWKEHWSLHDEAIKTGISDLEDYFK